MISLCCIICLLLPCCNGYPIDPGAMVASSTVGLAALALVFLVLSVIFLIGCACCRATPSNQGFKQFHNSTTSLSGIGLSNRLASEVSIFPPAGATAIRAWSPPPQGAAPPPSFSPTTRPANFSSSVPDVSDWFVDSAGNFPRQQLFYQRELGKGWFGKVVEGEARGLRVVVRILREDATPLEKAHFLHEARPYRHLRHRNVASLFSKATEKDPFLLIFNLAPNGDLKSFLVTNSGSKAALNEQGICLRMMTDIAEGLNYMIDNNFIHTDLAARNCLVCSDLTVKVGDYGTGIDIYKDEYYITENVAIPIRWCAPETLHCTPTTIEAKQVTSAANVWSLAVVLWEIAEFGRLPYEELTDDQVIIRVFGAEKLRLPQPDTSYAPFLYNMLQLCWRVNDRATMSQVLSMLHYLRSAPPNETDFVTRWNMTKPNTIPRVDNHPLANTTTSQQVSPLRHPNVVTLHNRSEFDSGVDLEMKATESCRSTTPISITSDDFLQSKRSASLTNLQGSLEDIRDTTLLTAPLADPETFDMDVNRCIDSFDESLDVGPCAEETHAAEQPLLTTQFHLGPLRSESSSDTEEETWRTRVERGEFTEKVKEKSKSVTDLMVLTHIDSEGSESDSLPSLTRQSKRKPAFTSVGFGSEGNITKAILTEDLQDKLKQLSLWKPQDQHFLGKAASETSKPVNNPFFKSRSTSVKSNKTVKNVDNCVNTSCDNPSLEHSKIQCVNKLKDLCINSINNEISEVSSHKHFIPIPEIRVVETNMPDVYTEPQTDVDTQFLMNVVPRKFVIVCRDSNDDFNYDSSSEDESNGQSKAKSVENPKQESRVILGSCEEYTLDYFKGLKTTFVPGDSLSDEGSEKNEVETTEDSDFVNDDSQVSHVCDDTKWSDFVGRDKSDGRNPDFIDDLGPDSLTASVTTISNSSGYATIEKDKVLRQDSSLIVDQSQSPIQKQSNSFNKGCVKDRTQHFIASEKEVSSLDLIDSELKHDEESKVSCPKFLVDDIVSQSAFTSDNCNYSSYFSDYGEGRSQHDEIKELKTRLEDAMKLNNDFHLKRDEEYSGKIVTPDDERSSDSGFRDKGSLSESAEDTCDEKFNIEDIDTELDDVPRTFETFESNTNEKKSKTDGIESWFLHHSRDQHDSGWLPESTEYEVRESVIVNADFIDAIRNELREKLPNASHLPEDDDLPEQSCAELQFNFPAQLSPILEEQESNQSSILGESPVAFTGEDLNRTYIVESISRDSLDELDVDHVDGVEEDLLVVDTETNEATLIESPKPQSHIVFLPFRTERSSFTEISPHHSDSLSSPENGNLSGFFLSPCSVRSDLFDSGPPSLPFDIGQSMEEVEDLSPHHVLTDSFADSTLSLRGSVEGDSKYTDLDSSCSLSNVTVISNNLKAPGTDECANQECALSGSSSSIGNDLSYKSDPTENRLLTNGCANFSIHDDILKSASDSQLFTTERSACDSVNLNFSEDKQSSFHTKQPVKESPLVSLDDDFLEDNKDDCDEIDKFSSLPEMPLAVESRSSDEWSETKNLKNASEVVGGNSWPIREVENWEKINGGLSSTLALASSPHAEYPHLPLTPCSPPASDILSWPPPSSHHLTPTPDHDTEEMTTSFIEPDENGTFTPDWDSDTSESSSCSEFIWKDGDKEEPIKPLLATPDISLSMDSRKMERIEEETFSEDGSSSSDSEGSCTSEFVPSTWNSSLLPTKSALRVTVDPTSTDSNPSVVKDTGCADDTKPDAAKTGNAVIGVSSLSKTKKKRVIFKKEKYHCVYEYPREPSDDDEEPCLEAAPSLNRPFWQTPSSDLEYFDWELGEGELNGSNEADSDSEDGKTTKNAFSFDEVEFFSKCSINDDERCQFLAAELNSSDEFTPLASDVGEVKECTSGGVLALGVLRHTKDQLKLDLRPAAAPDHRQEALLLDSGIDTSSA